MYVTLFRKGPFPPVTLSQRLFVVAEESNPELPEK